MKFINKTDEREKRKTLRLMCVQSRTHGKVNSVWKHKIKPIKDNCKGVQVSNKEIDISQTTNQTVREY